MEQPSTRPGRKMLKCVIVLLSCCACCNARLGGHAPRRHALALARINSSATPLVWSHGYGGGSGVSALMGDAILLSLSPRLQQADKSGRSLADPMRHVLRECIHRA